jgi:hypothetical protein
MGTPASSGADAQSLLESNATLDEKQALVDRLMHPELHRPVELDLKTAKEHHVLLPVRPAPLVIKPGCASTSKPLDAGSTGTFSVALLATSDFDVDQVDLSSLRFHGAEPVHTAFRDVNGDGVPDLLVVLRSADLHLAPDASTGRLSGWMKNSQPFYGEDKIRVVSSLLDEDGTCR